MYNHSQVMEKLLGISGDYWRQYLSPMEHPDPTVSPTPSVQSVQSSPALLSPATPELRPGENLAPFMLANIVWYGFSMGLSCASCTIIVQSKQARPTFIPIYKHSML